MPRFDPLTPASAEGKSKQLLEQVEKGVGRIPNILGTMANSPAVLQAYMNFSGALKAGKLDAKTRECLAMAVAGVNDCAYCAAAHNAMGQQAGLSQEELAACLRGESGDEKTNAAIHFARAIIETKGYVTDEQFSAVKNAGYSNEEVLEIVAVVALNTFTNYFNHVADTAIDFPKVEMP